MKRFPPYLQILSALFFATCLAWIFRSIDGGIAEDSRAARLINGCVSTSAFVGELFMRALKMLIVPLIVTSVISGITSLKGVKGFGRLGLKTAVFYLGSSTLAILIGLGLVNTLKPGLVDGSPNPVIREAFRTSAEAAASETVQKVSAAGEKQAADFLGVFRAMLPENVIQAATNHGQMLGVIVFSILFAIAITRLPGDRMRTIHEFFQAACDAMVVLTRWVMALAPIGVFGLILPVVYQSGVGLFTHLGKYFFTVLLALGLHLFVVLPLILRWIAGVSPLAHFRAMRSALLLAFSTASSAGTLPVTMRCVEDGARVPKRVTSFTLPLGATVNMDGTALYECVAVMFVAQVMGVQMGLAGQFFVVAAALLTSIGVAGVPSASMVAILLILKNSGIAGAETAVIALLSVDRLLDMSRTAVNVFSDSCAAVIVAKSEGELRG